MTLRKPPIDVAKMSKTRASFLMTLSMEVAKELSVKESCFVEGVFLPVSNALSDINKERATMERTWKKREFQLKTSLTSVINLYGNISGIAQLPELEALSTGMHSGNALQDKKRETDEGTDGKP